MARIAVIGCGWWATRAHLPALAAHPDATIAAIVDPDAANRSRAAQAFEVPPDRAFADVGEMLDRVELDGAIVAVPHAAHAAVATQVLERGLHTLLEKPMTLLAEDAGRLEQLARACGAELIVGYPWHYNAHVVELRAAIASGRIGTLELVTCQYASVARELYRGHPERYAELLGFPLVTSGARTYADPEVAGGGQGVTQTTHALALILHVTGLRPRSIAAMVEHHELDVDLVNGALIGFDDGALATVGTTGSLRPGQTELLELRVYGSYGFVVLDLTEGQASIVDAAGDVQALEPVPMEQRAPEDAPARNLVDVILGRGGNASPAATGALTVELVEGLYRAARERRLVDLGGAS